MGEDALPLTAGPHRRPLKDPNLSAMVAAAVDVMEGRTQSRGAGKCSFDPAPSPRLTNAPAALAQAARGQQRQVVQQTPDAEAAGSSAPPADVSGLTPVQAAQQQSARRSINDVAFQEGQTEGQAGVPEYGLAEGVQRMMKRLSLVLAHAMTTTPLHDALKGRRPAGMSSPDCRALILEACLVYRRGQREEGARTITQTLMLQHPHQKTPSFEEVMRQLRIHIGTLPLSPADQTSIHICYSTDAVTSARQVREEERARVAIGRLPLAEHLAVPGGWLYHKMKTALSFIRRSKRGRADDGADDPEASAAPERRRMKSTLHSRFTMSNLRATGDSGMKVAREALCRSNRTIRYLLGLRNVSDLTQGGAGPSAATDGDGDGNGNGE